MRFGFILILTTISAFANVADAQIGTRFPSERKVLTDPITGVKLVFLTSTPAGDSKIYPTHNQWTSDGRWLIFRSGRVKGEAFAVHEETGDIVQVSEGGYTGMLNVARLGMKLYFMRYPASQFGQPSNHETKDKHTQVEIVEVNLETLFADSQAGKLRTAEAYQRVCGITPVEIGAGGDMALDADENWAYFRIGREEAARHLPQGVAIERNYGPRNMGAGPSGIAAMNLQTGEIRHVISVPFQVGHIQTNPWVQGEIIFCWETGGKSPQRTWTVRADGSGLRPLYPESEYEWVTHEAVITKDEVAFAIMGHRQIAGVDTTGTEVSGANPGQEAAWGPSGTRQKPTGLAIVNLRSREMMIAGQTTSGSGLWHVHGSHDGRFAVGDDFARNLYLIDRRTREMILLSSGHKATAADHPHPTFSPDGTKVEIQSAMLSADNRSMNICIVHLPEAWLRRK